ncbi:MAG TPA: CHAT domain-containing protein, partial [Candidatus Sulfopaludibacter sp.]|nr:CHAT domain-containing protein [Candidatus Sulfopaludibacter sp.]
TFEALEENRASSLRLLRAGKSGSLPPEYWEALLALQRAEIQALRSGKAADQAASAAARARVARLEASFASRPAVSEGDLLRRAQAALHADSALFSFHLGGDISWMWAVDRTHIELYALPPRAEIAGLVRNAVGATESDSAETAAAGAALYEALFGRLPARFRNKPNWVVALDESLFDAPLAALVVRGEARPAYLVELHATQAIPGVGWWLDAAERPAAPASPLFVGIGDPVYNAADPRLTTRQRASAARPAIPGQLAAEGFALPRLVASGAEIEACARAWTGDRILLTGTSASPQNLSEQLKRNPEVVHFATHVVESTARPSDGAIALSLSEGGGAQLLGPGEIADWRIRARLVAISGCHSAAGDVLPGTGLLGLTRAWLAAGADSVAGSRWATPDETGALFSSLYRNLRARPGTGPAQALRAAQLEMLRSGDWRAKPRYWGAYFVIGIEGVQ